MALCTYLNEQEFKQYSEVNDTELNKLFQEVRTKFPEYFMQKYEFEETRFLRKCKIIERFTIYYRLNSCEVQELQLPTGLIRKESVMAFFYGILNAIEK